MPIPTSGKSIVRQLERSREATDLETQLRCKDGSITKVEISLRYVEIDGELCTLCIGRDITERLAAESALRASEEKFEQVFRRSPDGIIILKQRDLTIYDINDSFLLAAQYGREELLGQVHLRAECLSKTTMRFPKQPMRSASRASSRTVRWLSTPRMVSRCRRWFPPPISRSTVSPACSASPKTSTSCGRRRRSCASRSNGSEARSKTHRSASFSSICKGTIFQANNFAEEVLGYDRNPLAGHAHQPAGTERTDRAQLKETFARLSSGKDETVRTECRMLREDELELWTNFHVVVQRDAQGEPAYLIGQIADITEMKSSQSRMERMAFYDTLTNLANRRLFYDRLGQAVDHAQRSRHLSALLYLDLDQFKRVNDTLGHEVGDVLLQEVSTRLTSCVRQEDTVARLGGDEFTVLLFDIKTPSDASLVADKILSTPCGNR